MHKSFSLLDRCESDLQRRGLWKPSSLPFFDVGNAKRNFAGAQIVTKLSLMKTEFMSWLPSANG